MTPAKSPVGLASSPVNSSARSVGTVGGSVTFVRHLEKEALSNPARSGRTEEDAWGRGYCRTIAYERNV